MLTKKQVFSSFVTQSSLALLIFGALFVLHTPAWVPFQKKARHAQSLVTALVEFHKAQCYFAGAIQIAAVIFAGSFRKTMNRCRDGSATDELPTFLQQMDAELLFTLSTNGTLPIAFTLTCIARYGRQSWYLILLSVSTITISTTTLIYASILWPSVAESLSMKPTLSLEFCAGNLQDYESWCGSGKTVFNTSITPDKSMVGWSWVLWITAMSWVLYSTIEFKYKISKKWHMPRFL